MSIPVKHSVTCPDCGKPIEFTMWQSINTEMEFAIPDIISGKLFEIECKNCGLKTRVDYPILFNDMIHNTMIYYTFPDGIQETEKACDSILNTGSNVRIVTTQNDLREKARLLNDGLDDRIIELLKALVWSQIQEEMKEKQIEKIYYLQKDNGYTFELLYDGGSAVATLPFGHYDYVKEKYGKCLVGQNTSYYIDQEWADRFLKEI